MEQQIPLADKKSFLRNDTLLVCGMLTFERLNKGGVALLVEVEEKEPLTIWFDNFGLQPR